MCCVRVELVVGMLFITQAQRTLRKTKSDTAGGSSIEQCTFGRYEADTEAPKTMDRISKRVEIRSLHMPEKKSETSNISNYSNCATLYFSPMKCIFL